jgi:membrane protein
MAIEYFDDHCPQLAAAMAYYALFAVFPLVILAVGVFGLVEGDASARHDIIQLITDNVPLASGGRKTLEDALRGAAGSAGVFSVLGVLGLLFSSSGVMAAVRNAVNTAFDLPDRRPPVQGKLLDLALVVSVAVAAGVSLGITVAHRLAPDLGGASGVLDVIFDLVPIALNFVIFAFVYRVVPATTVRLRDIWPGAVIAALGYEAVKAGFAFYLSNFGHYGDVYGSLAAAVVFLFFVFLAANVFLLGAEAASEWPRVRAGHYEAHEARTERTLGQELKDLGRRLVLGDPEDEG